MSRRELYVVKENLAVRRAAKSAGVPLWKIAASIGISEPTIIRWLRFPLPEEKERRIMDAISSLAKEVS